MASQKTFSERVNYAARWIVSGRPTTRSFDNCFENSDGDAVVLALCRRAEKNERLRQALPRYIAETSIRDVPTRYAGRRPSDVSREQRQAARTECVKAWGEEFAATIYGPPAAETKTPKTSRRGNATLRAIGWLAAAGFSITPAEKAGDAVTAYAVTDPQGACLKMTPAAILEWHRVAG